MLVARFRALDCVAADALAKVSADVAAAGMLGKGVEGVAGWHESKPCPARQNCSG